MGVLGKPRTGIVVRGVAPERLCKAESGARWRLPILFTNIRN